ncbi:glycosyl hydrolase family 28 protein [uncultured Bacteroides sp.]|uniref:rhamnogalacturonidase n=1 Tax=uncultured Bacteroides sp. TaxID=162156 RepID=UPI00261F61B8|nr:glycosyl hydrolase family 28 protein [uncultured Bacteroides sp.]
MNTRIFLCLFTLVFGLYAVPGLGKDLFPDGTPIPDWFYRTEIIPVDRLGKIYNIADWGVLADSTLVQTEKIQAVIDKAAEDGGGVIYIPEGTFLSGSLFFKPRTHLYIARGGTLKGSDDISDFKVIDTRMEGQNLKYFAALVNATGVDGFTVSGEGCINGNGLRYWKSFWLRREINPKCTNLEEMRPRLLFISDSKDVQLSGVKLINSPFWTTHLYRCENVKLLGLSIFAPRYPVKAPSSDAIDIDVCTNVLVKNCYMSVNDDAIGLKGGKGPWADQDTINNGANRNIIIEDCTYGFCHSALTFGSESVHDRNIVLRRCRIDQAQRLLWLKMRPDTPQNYEYILIEDISGNAKSFLYAKPWTQFFDLKGRKDIPYSYSSNLTMQNIRMECDIVFDIEKADDQYRLSDFVFRNLELKSGTPIDEAVWDFSDFVFEKVYVNGREISR